MVGNRVYALEKELEQLKERIEQLERHLAQAIDLIAHRMISDPSQNVETW